MSSDLKDRVKAFVTLHAYSQLLIYPYSNKKHFYPPDIEDLVSHLSIKAINLNLEVSC